MTQKWICKKATEADDFEVGELLVRSFISTYAKKMPEVKLTEHRLAELRDVTPRRKLFEVLILQNVDTKQIGATITLVLPGQKDCRAWVPQHCEAKLFVVDPTLHKMGLGAQMMSDSIALAKSHGMLGSCIQVRRGAHGLIESYKKMGYVRDPRGDRDLLPEIFLEGYTLTFA